MLKYFTSNSKANINTYNKVDDLTRNNNLIIVDYEVYNYYRNSKFKDYEVLYADIMSNDYTFMVKSNNDSFFDLFNYFIKKWIISIDCRYNNVVFHFISFSPIKPFTS